MSTDHQPTIDKLRIIAEMSQAPETKQLCNVMVEYIQRSDEKPGELGFKAFDQPTNPPEGR